MTLDRTIAPTLHWKKKITLPTCINKQEGGIAFTLFLDPNTSVLGFRFVFPRIDAVGNNPLLGHAAMEMLLRGTATKNTEQLFQALETLGARIRTSAARDYNEVTLRTSLRNLEPSLALLHEVLFIPRMAQEDFEQWLEESKAEFIVNLEDPAYLAGRALRSTLYGTEHFYGELLQTEHYETLTLDDVKQYWQQNIVSNCPSVIVAGGLKKEITTDPIATIAAWEFAKPTTSLRYGILRPTASAIVHTPVPSGTQVPMYMGCLLPRHPFSGEYDLRIAVALFGGVFSSRLMQNLREDKGYTYGIRAGISFYYDTGVLSIRTNVGNEYAKNATEEIRNEFDRMQTVPATERELEILRGQLLGDSMQALDGVWDAAASMFIYGFPVEEWYQNTRKKIEAISRVGADEIVSIASEWLRPDRFVLSVAGKEEVLHSLDWPLI